MNKKNVDLYMPYAYKAVNYEINTVKSITAEEASKYRSQISSFGAAITMGSVSAAILFFSTNGSSDINRALLLNMIYKVINKTEDYDTASSNQIMEKIAACKNLSNEQIRREQIINAENLEFFQSVQNGIITKDQIIEASIAIKLIFNLFIIKKEDTSYDIQ